MRPVLPALASGTRPKRARRPSASKPSLPSATVTLVCRAGQPAPTRSEAFRSSSRVRLKSPGGDFRSPWMDEPERRVGPSCRSSSRTSSEFAAALSLCGSWRSGRRPSGRGDHRGLCDRHNRTSIATPTRCEPRPRGLLPSVSRRARAIARRPYSWRRAVAPKPGRRTCIRALGCGEWHRFRDRLCPIPAAAALAPTEDAVAALLNDRACAGPGSRRCSWAGAVARCCGRRLLLR
jgi:hypothetical protein